MSAHSHNIFSTIYSAPVALGCCATNSDGLLLSCSFSPYTLLIITYLPTACQFDQCCIQLNWFGLTFSAADKDAPASSDSEHDRTALHSPEVVGTVLDNVEDVEQALILELKSAEGREESSSSSAHVRWEKAGGPAREDEVIKDLSL